jgi:extradiol dioxygenase family protein
MTKPFHLSIVVPDLERARTFYVNLLDCKVGRDKGQWIDILFFGHQMTLHQERNGMVAKAIDHFGPILEKEEWKKVSDRFRSNGIAFEMQPLIKEEGTDTESGKFIVKDPADNILEFKYYKSFSTTVEESNKSE